MPDESKKQDESLELPEQVTPVSAPESTNKEAKTTVDSQDEPGSNTTHFTEEPASHDDHMDAIKAKYSLPEVKNTESGASILRMNTPILLAAAVVIVAILAGLMIWARHEDPVSTTDESATEVPIVSPRMDISLGLLEGTAEVSNSEAALADAEFIALNDATRLREGQYVRTATDSRLELSLGDGSFIRLAPNSTIQIQNLREDDVSIELFSGQIYSRVVSDAARSFVVTTDEEQYRSIGTAYRVLRSDVVESVSVYQSSVRLSDGTTTIEQGETYNHANKNNSELEKTVIKTPLKETTNDTFVLWNRERDLASDAFKDKLGSLQSLDAPKLTLSTAGDTTTTTEASIKVSGTTDAENRLTINDSSVSVDSDGTFSTTIELELGENIITAVATNPSGNSSEQTLKITRTNETAEATDEFPITLVGQAGSTGIDVAWTVLDSAETTGLFRIVYTTNGTPSYDENTDSQLTDDEGSVIPKSDGQTYQIRVCVFNQSADSCDQYSNEISVTAPSS